MVFCSLVSDLIFSPAFGEADRKDSLDKNGLGLQWNDAVL